MFARTAALALAISAVFTLEVAATLSRIEHAVRAPSHDFLGPPSLNRRTLTGQTIAFACYGGGGDCECPTDNNGDSGVLIHVYPGYQCAYPNGACTWSDVTGNLVNVAQTNCPGWAPCSKSGGCSCPKDNHGDTGVLINQFTGYQCAYNGGACTWDFDGNLQDIHQTNCPAFAKCKQSGEDS